VVLLSGGLDSATVLAVAQRDGFTCHTLSVDYGQRHRVELDAARAVAATAGVEDHRVVHVDLRAFGGSALTDDVQVPKPGTPEGIGASVPITYVPARNTVLLSCALAFAEVLGAIDLFIGANAVDYSGYPDCRPEYLAAFEAMAALATRAAVEDGARVRVHAPLVALRKAEIIELGTALGVDYAQTVTCYDPDGGGAACGACEACVLRREGFAAAGIADPTRYRRG
jgi:7-cyano-7-deazaguanine synthase